MQKFREEGTTTRYYYMSPAEGLHLVSSHLASLPPATSAAAQRWGWGGGGTALRAHATCGAAISGGCCAAPAM
jgi:hypothetical protein